MPVLVRATRSVVTTVVTDTYVRGRDTLDYTGRIAMKAEVLLDEVIETLRVGRPLLVALAAAVEDGLLVELMAAVRQVDRATDLLEKATDQLDNVLPLLDATAPFTGIVNTGIGQVSRLPGVNRVRRRPVEEPVEVVVD